MNNKKIIIISFFVLCMAMPYATYLYYGIYKSIFALIWGQFMLMSFSVSGIEQRCGCEIEKIKDAIFRSESEDIFLLDENKRLSGELLEAKENMDKMKKDILLLRDELEFQKNVFDSWLPHLKEIASKNDKTGH